jgi:hypothetical protein
LTLDVARILLAGRSRPIPDCEKNAESECMETSPIVPERLKSFCKAILNAFNHRELTG